MEERSSIQTTKIRVLRAIIYYPLNAGRNMQEILRLIDALQTVEKHNVALPANWKPSDKLAS